MAHADQGEGQAADAATSAHHNTLTFGTYNCEGLFSAMPYIGELLVSCDVLFVSETWVSLSEECILPRLLSEFCPVHCFSVQSFAMEHPPGAGEGRRHGGVALICRNRPGFRYVQVPCDDARLCGVTLCDDRGPCLTFIGCYMPYWNFSEEHKSEYAQMVSKLDALILAHRAAAPVILLGDMNCALPRMSPALRPPRWCDVRGFNPFSALLQQLLDDHELLVAEFRSFFLSLQPTSCPRGDHCA